MMQQLNIPCNVSYRAFELLCIYTSAVFSNVCYFLFVHCLIHY